MCNSSSICIDRICNRIGIIDCAALQSAAAALCKKHGALRDGYDMLHCAISRFRILRNSTSDRFARKPNKSTYLAIIINFPCKNPIRTRAAFAYRSNWQSHSPLSTAVLQYHRAQCDAQHSMLVTHSNLVKRAYIYIITSAINECSTESAD